MKKIIVVSVLAALAVTGLTLGTALAEPGPAQVPGSKPVCLQTSQIQSTRVIDNQTILFHMVDGKIWKNSLPYRCSGLKMQEGFAYDVHNNEICSNLQSIRVLQSQVSCPLGEFTPYTASAPIAQ